MQSKVRLLGHAVHPMLVDFPIVCFPLLVACDLADGMGWMAMGKFPLLLTGVGGGVAILAIITGTIDLAFLPGKTRAHSIAVWHFAVGLGIWAMYGVSSWAHVGTNHTWTVTVDVLGSVIVFTQGYLGGELMERHHIGVLSAAEGADPVVLSRKKA